MLARQSTALTRRLNSLSEYTELGVKKSVRDIKIYDAISSTRFEIFDFRKEKVEGVFQ